MATLSAPQEEVSRPRTAIRLAGEMAPGTGLAADLVSRLQRAGLAPARLRPGDPDAVVLTLAPVGWERLNLAALVARARANPGRQVSAGESAQAVAPAGTADQTVRRPPLLRPVPVPDTILLDRDGTILEPHPYLGDSALVALLPGAAEGLRGFAAMGCRLAILTNQSGIGRGLITAEEVAAVHARMQALLHAHGVRLEGIFVCPHAPDAACACRKPGDGLVREAQRRLGLDLRRAVVVGDAVVDIGLARQLNVPAALVLTGEGRHTLAVGPEPPDLVVDDLAELADLCRHPGGFSLDPRATRDTT